MNSWQLSVFSCQLLDSGWQLITDNWQLDQRILCAHLVSVILENLVNLTRADFRDLSGDAVMQAVLGRRRRTQILFVRREYLLLGFRQWIGNVVERSLIIVKHVQPPQHLPSADYPERFGNFSRQLRQTIALLSKLIPVH